MIQLDYETLDWIADSYIPLLTFATLVIATKTFKTSTWQQKKACIITLTTFLTIAYGLMFLDNHLKIWHSFKLDYSTHTAVSLILVIFLSILLPALSPFWITSLICYILLMLYQKYHTIADIATTALVVGTLSLLVVIYQYKYNMQNTKVYIRIL